MAESKQALKYRSLERVKQLRGHLPLDAAAHLLYEEHQASDDRLAYETKTLDYLRRLLAQPLPVTIVLTGNAGHGKTHMCRRLLEKEGANENVMARLINDVTGTEDWKIVGASLPVRVIKDLSELNPPEKAAERLEEFVRQENSHVIVCANEGRLRDVVGRRPELLIPLLKALEHGHERGDTSPPGRGDIHVVNLNYQAASAGEGGFLKHVLDHFLNHESAWKVCNSCAANEGCPILANRNTLSRSPASPPANAVHREAFTELVRIAEEGGYVLTYRETLVLVAYLITGNLSCADVEVMHRKNKLAPHTLLQHLFEPRLTNDEAGVLRILERVRRLDPGRVALRPVDERIHEELENRDQLGVGVFGELNQQTHKRAELKKEASGHRECIRNARRAAWLSSTDTADGVRRAERLGLRYHYLFKSLQVGQGVRETIATIRALVKGLHTIQGAVGVDSKTNFYLVDPAFGRSGSHSAVIARSLKVKELELWPESEWWRRRGEEGSSPPILDSVEWLDRRIVLAHGPMHEVILSLDLLAFEFVLNAGHGIVMKDFHSAERRRILRTLARHAEKGREADDEEIRILLRRGEGALTVERDGTILLERST